MVLLEQDVVELLAPDAEALGGKLQYLLAGEAVQIRSQLIRVGTVPGAVDDKHGLSSLGHLSEKIQNNTVNRKEELRLVCRFKSAHLSFWVSRRLV